MELVTKISISLIIRLLVVGLGFGMFMAWMITNQSFMNSSLSIQSKKQLSVNSTILNREYPIINAKNKRIKKDEQFDIKTHVTATDPLDGDISKSLSFYGDIDASKKGIYKVRCVVRNSAGLKTVKYVQVVVD